MNFLVIKSIKYQLSRFGFIAKKRDLVDEYGLVLENCGMVGDVAELPASKTEIKAELIRFAKQVDTNSRADILAGYLQLAIFQDTRLRGVNEEHFKALGQKSGTELVDGVLDMKDQIENSSAIFEVINAERRALAIEWQRAGLEN